MRRETGGERRGGERRGDEERGEETRRETREEILSMSSLS